ncbi:Lamin-like protein, partial [Phytophthora palmivora]
MYGYKLECSVAYPGVAIDLSPHEPGSKSDLTMFLDRKAVHMDMLQKTMEELEIEDNGEGGAQHPLQWGVLVDKGYQGSEGSIRTIQPKRKPRGSELSHQDVARNRLVSSDRVLVENFFGRVCMLWKAMYVTYKWNETSSAHVFESIMPTELSPIKSKRMEEKASLQKLNSRLEMYVLGVNELEGAKFAAERELETIRQRMQQEIDSVRSRLTKELEETRKKLDDEMEQNAQLQTLEQEQHKELVKLRAQQTELGEAKVLVETLRIQIDREKANAE